jgi:6-phosphogluconolactonase
MAPTIPGLLVETADTEDASHETSTRVAEALRQAVSARGSATLALSGGNSPRGAYVLLSRERGIDWTRVHVFWVDERVAPPTDDRSNYRWAKATLLDAVPIPDDRVHRMQTDSADLDGAARAYERAIRSAVRPNDGGMPSFDAMVLGVGDDGHTASLFPGEPTIDIRDRLVATVPAAGTREARMTLTVPVIEEARMALVLAVGPSKRVALQRAWDDRGDIHETPARILRACTGSLVWVVDRAVFGRS